MTPDYSEKLGGRGAWVAADRAALERAVSKGLFSRAFKQAATAPADLVDTVEAGIRARALSAIGLARRAGEAVAGFDQVKEALVRGRAGVLITASDAADDGRAKLARIAGGAFQFRGFDSASLSRALGKDGVRHAALFKGAAAERFRREAGRLAGILGDGAGG